MASLRQQIIDAMQQRYFSISTHQSHLGLVSGLARFFNQLPDQLRATQIYYYFSSSGEAKGSVLCQQPNVFGWHSISVFRLVRKIHG